MQLRYSEDFIESAVFLCASGRCGLAPMLVARFHHERERLYAILDPDQRNAAFFKLHLERFRGWGQERPLADMLNEFPLVREALTTLAVREAPRRIDEGAELYVNESGQRTGLLALRPERLLDAAALKIFLRHEFTHLHDMLDPAFGYSPALELPRLNAAQARLARERYRLLWDITIDGRLAAAGYTPTCGREQYAVAFARAYAFWPEQRRVETFASLWRNAAPCHADLLALVADPRGLREAHRPAPGASCPLCDFPTFAWADVGGLASDILDRVTGEFPAWSPEQGMCNRCLEAYQAAALSP